MQPEKISQLEQKELIRKWMICFFVIAARGQLSIFWKNGICNAQLFHFQPLEVILIIWEVRVCLKNTLFNCWK